MFALRRCLPLAFLFFPLLAHAADPVAQVQQFAPQGELESVRQVTARFSTDMVRLGDPRVKNPFTVSCVAKGRGRWVDTRNWAYDFDADVPRNHSCTFTLVKDQRDAAGQPLTGRRSFAFNTSPLAEAPVEKAAAGEIAIDFFVPQGEAYPVRQVQVRFSEDMVRLGSGLMNPFGVGCAVRGKGRWVDTRNWVYDFDADLPSGIACQFVAVKGLRGVSGKPLRAYAPLKFNTGGPRIMDARPYSSYEGIDENQVFLLKFDGDNDRNSLPRSAYCLAENIKEKIPLRFLAVEEARAFVEKLPEEYRDWWNSPDKRVRERRAVSCARQLPPGAKVQLVFAKGLLSATGVASSADQVLSFKVRPAFTAKFSCTRENARQACAPMTAMTLEFTDTVPAELLQGIRLEGAGQVRKPKGNAYDDEYGEGEGVGGDEIVAGNVVTFPGPFPPEAAFTLKIPANFKDESGRPLVNASRFPLAVKTANYPPLAKFAANFGIIEKAAGAVPLTLRNLEPGKGVTPEARLFTYKLPDSDIELLRWLGRFNKHQNKQSCYDCGRRDEAGNLLDPDPRSLSLLASIKGVNVQTLPRTLAAKEFEVIGLPVTTGAYVHEVESRYLGESLIANKAPMYVSALSIVTNLGVHLRHGPQGSLVWVTTLDKGQPVANADVSVLDCKGGSAVWRGKTDAQGLARFDTPRDFSEYADGCMGRYAVVARSGADRGIVLPGWDEGIESWRFNVSSGWHDSGNLIAHSILDRSLLRAGETLHMRHVVRETSLQSLTAPRNARYKKLFVRYDGGGQEYELPLNIGKDGNGENEWKIPAAAKLGRYSILLEAGDREYALGSFRVEEFRLPVLKAQLQLPGGPQILPDSLPVDMQLQYINGGSYPKAAVTLRGQVSSTGTSFKDFEDYSFSYSRYRDDEEGGDYEDGDSPIALEEQALTLDERGGLRADSGKLPAISKVSQLRVEMEYRDPSGETHTATASASLWPAAVIPGVKLPSWITLSGNAPQKVEIVTLGPDGKPRANIAIKASAELRSRQSHRRRTVGGFYAYESVQKKEALPVQCAGRSDSKGRLSCTVTPAVSGELVLNVEAADEKGRIMRSNASTWVSTGDRWWFDQGNDDRIDLLPEKKEYRAGDTMKLQVRMPFPEATALIGVERDGVMETFVQTLKSSNPVISLPVKADYAPNVYVSVLLVRGRNDTVAPTALIDLGKPAFKLGIAEVKVGWEAWRLGVNVKTDKPRYHPRDKAQVSVQVTPPAQQSLPAGTEVTLAAVDEALLELAGNDSWDVLTPMMASRSHDVDTATSQLQVVGKRHYGRKALPPGGGGGRGGSTRELFDTLIYWQARAKVDANGQAQFSVPLNDSLTGFRIVAVATSENRFGSGDTRMESFQDVSVLPGLPLVVRQGDKLDPGFTLRNSSDKAQTLKFTAELEGRGKLLEKTVTVAPGTSTVVAVPFTVPADVEKLDLVLSAEGQDASDRVRLSQKVLDPVPERVLQGTLLQLEKPTEIPVQKPADALPGGAIQVSGQARLSDSLDDVKRYFEKYPYSCLEQKTSRAAGLQDRARWNEVMELLPVYLDDKGFAAFYPNTAGYPFLSAYILRVSKGLGWPVPEASRQRMLDGLVNYVEGRAGFEDWRLRELDDAHRRLEVLTLLAQYGRFKPSQLDTLRIDPPRWTTSMLVNWFELLRASPAIPRRDERLAQAESLLRSRLTLQGSAYLLSEGEYSWWWLYDNDQATVARLMLATMDLPAWKDDEPRLLRGLLMRQREGRWDTTIANLWGGMALKRFSETFERDPVMGRTELRLAAQEKSLDWVTAQPEAQRLDWPAKPDVLKLAQEGSGKPWITVQARARVPLKAPLSTGFKVVKMVEPVQRKTAGQWSVGDVVRVTLKLEAQSDIGWVAVDDPIPAGSTLLGRALGRDSSMAAEAADAWTWATFAEFGADSYRAYYERIYKGEWEVRYTLRLNQSGDFRLPPTRVEAMYAPEMFGMTPNANWVVKP
ncbi:MAG TPA: MG2 domain-containing protein [Moraxellaceae bacterium]